MMERLKILLSNTKNIGDGVKTICKRCMSVIVVLMTLVFTQNIKAQQDFINGFYMFNPLAFNPAIVGVNDQMVISAIAREQWTGLNGAPSTQYVNYHTPVFSWYDRYDRPGRITYPTGLSTGVSIVNDKLGATNFSRLSIPIGVRVRLTGSGIRLSMGIRVDGSRLSANYTGLRSIDPISDEYLNNEAHKYIDFATGVYVYHTQWYFGVSMTNMRGISIPEFGYFFDKHYYASAGYALPVNDDFIVRLTTLATIVQGAPYSMTVTPAVIIKDNIETGITYRYNDMIGAFFSFKPISNLKIGYWYEYPIGVKVNEIGATHELLLKLSFDSFKKKVTSPRYFW